jgi:hypothetical protein
MDHMKIMMMITLVVNVTVNVIVFIKGVEPVMTSKSVQTANLLVLFELPLYYIVTPCLYFCSGSVFFSFLGDHPIEQCPPACICVFCCSDDLYVRPINLNL